MKRIICLSIIFVFVLNPIFTHCSVEWLSGNEEVGTLIQEELVSRISAESVLVGDAKTGRVIYQKNAEIIRQVASLTKIMTAIVVLENGNLDTVVKVGKTDRAVNSWKLGLKKGHRINLRNLLLAFLIESRNDAALCAAESVAGSKREFVKIMNKRPSR